MSKCRKCRSQITEAFYDELNAEEKEWFFSHLESCSVCASEYEKMTATLRTFSQPERAEPGEMFWDNYWDNLEGKLDAPEKSGFSVKLWWQHIWGRFQFQPQMAYRFAMGVALVVVGVLIGKFYFSSPQTQQPYMTETIQQAELPTAQASLETRANRYIDRSKILLLGLVNFDASAEDTYALDLPYQKKISQDLVHEAAYLKGELTDPAQMQLRELISDLEMILLQIANLENEHDLAAIDIVKSGVDQTGLLLKINLDKMERKGQLPGADSEQKKINHSQI